MVWKKNSVAERPEKNELPTKPLASGVRSPRRKWGSVRSKNPE
jgi:hypothetical protein